MWPAEGLTVTVVRPTDGGTDRLGNPVEGEPALEVVADVLVQSPTTADLEAARPYGATVSYTLQFPIAYASSLSGCEVVLPAPCAGTYRVVGDPRPNPHAPHRFANRWNRTVLVEVADG